VRLRPQVTVVVDRDLVEKATVEFDRAALITSPG